MSFADRMPESVKKALAERQLPIEPEQEELPVDTPPANVDPPRETFGSAALDEDPE